jgi:hypothetical protein
MNGLMLIEQLKEPVYCSHLGSKHFGAKCSDAGNCLQVWPHCAADTREDISQVEFSDSDVTALESILRGKGGLRVERVVVGSGMSSTIWNVLSGLDSTRKDDDLKAPEECILTLHGVVHHQIRETDIKKV